MKTIPAANRPFSFDESRDYWKFAPSAKGKVNTLELCNENDADFLRDWRESYDGRLDHYWEDFFFVKFFARTFAGKRVLSFGSGMGFNELQFLRAGAEVTCADIVKSNLGVIERVCHAERIATAKFLFMTNSAETTFPGPFDYIFVRGSLMTMPFDLQARAMANFKKALKPGGMIILNLYTKKFLDDTCGVDDPMLFARATDPSVGEQHCPWSDWHDDEKLLRLAGDDMFVSHRQFWNQGWYVWYALARKAEHSDHNTRQFFDLDGVARGSCQPLAVLRPDKFSPADSSVKTLAGGRLEVTTAIGQYGYALTSGLITAGNRRPDWLSVDLELQRGTVSVGILEPGRSRNILKRLLGAPGEDRFVLSRVIGREGRFRHYFSLRRLNLPARFKVLLCNHQVKGPAASKFVLEQVSLEKQGDISFPVGGER